MTRRGGLGAAQVALLSQQPAMFSAILAATATGTGTRVDDPVNRVDVWGLMGVVWELPTAVLTKVPRFIRDKLGLNPMPMERVIKEIADEEIARREDNSTDERPSQRQWEDLKNDMDENGVPSPWEAGARLLKDRGLWPF